MIHNLLKNCLILGVCLLASTSAYPTPPPPSDAEVITLTPNSPRYQTVKDVQPKIRETFPKGEVENAEQLGLVFSEPMVPLLAVDKPLTDTPPISIYPHVAGHWRWLNTRTLAFKPDAERFPFSTEFEVVASGKIPNNQEGVAEFSKHWSFSTPTLEVRSIRSPTPGIQKHTTLTIGLNQPVDVDAIEPYLELTDGSRNYDFEVSIPKQEKKGVRYISLWENVLVKSTTALPNDTKMQLRILPGMPAKEGPLASTHLKEYTFKTHDSLKIESQSRRNDALVIYFNNSLLENQDIGSHIAMEPEVDRPRFEVDGIWLIISGIDPQTEYQVTAGKSIVDIFDQPLGKSETLTFEPRKKAPPKNKTYRRSSVLRINDNIRYSRGQMIPPFIVLGPKEPKSIPFEARNLRSLSVEIKEVKPEDYAAYSKIVKWYIRGGKKAVRDKHDQDVPGKTIKMFSIKANGEINQYVDGAIELNSALDAQGSGNLLLLVKAFDNEGSWISPHHIMWIQSTNLGLHAAFDVTQMTAWVTSLDDAKPIEGARVETDKEQSTTDADGIAIVPRHNSGGSLRVGKDGDNVFSPEIDEALANWNQTTQDDHLWSVFDDRGIYKLGETVTIKGIVRKLSPEPMAHITATEVGTTASWIAMDAMDNELATGDAPINDQGGFDFTLDLPTDMPLGDGRIRFDLFGPHGQDEPTSTHTHRFTVNEFRRPEYEVSVSFPEENHYIGDPFVARALANYYSGGPLADATIDWTFLAARESFRPPGCGHIPI